MDYFKTYEAMYQHGYRDKHKCAGAAFFHYSHELLRFKSALDVGCGWGEAVNWFKDRCDVVYGVDVSATAVQYGRSKNLSVELASATDLPFSDGCVEAVVSSDLVEHLEPDDVPVAVNEMLRVASKYVVLQIAMGRTKDRWNDVTDVEQVHLTQRNEAEWRKFFANVRSANIAFFGSSKHHVFVILAKRELSESRYNFYATLYDKLHSAGLPQQRKNNADRFVKHLCETYEFNDVVDVGTGYGKCVEELVGFGKAATGVEIAKHAVDFMKERSIPHVQASGTDLPFEDSSFDLVLASDFMEHLREKDVTIALEEFRRVTRKFVALQIGLAPAKGDHPKAAGYGFDNVHLTLWPAKKWRRVCVSVGFKDSYVSTSPAWAKKHMKTRLLWLVLEK